MSKKNNDKNVDKSFLQKSIFIIKSNNSQIVKLFILTSIAGIIDVFGIGLIGPFISLIIDGSESFFFIFLKNSLPQTNNLDEIKLYLFIFLIFIFTVRAIIGILVNYWIHRYAENQSLKIKNSLMKSYLKMPFSRFINRNRSEYIHSLNFMTNQFTSLVLISSLQTISSIIIGLMIIILLAYTNINFLILSFIAFTGFIILYDRFISANAKKYGKKYNLENTILMQTMNEGIDGFKEIRIYGNEEYFLNKFLISTKKSAFYVVMLNLFSTMPRYLFELFIIIMGLISLSIFMSNESSISSSLQILAIYTVSAIRLIPMMNQISNNILNFRSAKDSVNKLYSDLNDFENSKKYNSKSANLNKKFNQIIFENINFKYQKKSLNTLNNINLEINKNDFIGIIGSSGSGKTTLINLFLGLLTPLNGKIFFNNKELNYNIEKLSLNVSYIPQQLFFLDDTIESNIALNSNINEIDSKHLNECIKKARLETLIETLPLGLKTNIGERGIKLSGGQTQRIALARAFYHGKEIIVMDESTNSLDHETEKLIMNELLALKKTITLIMISHRTTTLKICDRVYSIKEGSLSLSDSYKNLVNDGIIDEAK